MKLDLSQLQTAETRVRSDRATRINSALSRINAGIDDVMTRHHGCVPLSEMLGWAVKETAARALLDGTATCTQTALLQAEALQTAEDCTALATSILRRAEAFQSLAASITGLRRNALAAMRVATTTKDIDSVTAETLAALDALDALDSPETPQSRT